MRLAEALGIKTEAGWDSVAKKRNMQRYGTQSRRDQQGPTPYFNNKGTGSAQRAGTAASATPNMTPRPGGLNIPGGTDRPGQGNPLMAPPRKGPLGGSANTPAPVTSTPTTGHGRPDDQQQQGDADWLSMLLGDDEDSLV